MNQRAITYRRPEQHSRELGNGGQRAGDGVWQYGRDLGDGRRVHAQSLDRRNELYGEFLVNAQGEDVVAGIRTPQNITEAARSTRQAPTRLRLKPLMPDAFARFVATTRLLEKHYRDMQDLEFTIERGKLWMLQTRNGKRTARASLRVAVEMANEGLISQADAIARIEPASLDQLLHPMIDPKAPRNVLATGLPASPGAASGEIVFSSDEAEQLAEHRPQGYSRAHRDVARGYSRHARR